MILNIMIVALVAAFALRSPFDERHQRRLFVLGSDNVSSLRDVWQLFTDGLGVLGRSPLMSDTFTLELQMARLDFTNSSTTLQRTLV
jgi:hypothetical protein